MRSVVLVVSISVSCIAYNECSSYCFGTIDVKVTNGIAVFRTTYGYNHGLVLALGFLITLHAQFAFATLLVGSPLTPNFNIQSGSGDSANSTGYIVCNPNCYIASNSEAQPAYRLTVNVPSRPFGTSRVGIPTTTENGYKD
jgi:hypothetical protein